jgi:hypothetical protein
MAHVRHIQRLVYIGPENHHGILLQPAILQSCVYSMGEFSLLRYVRESVWGCGLDPHRSSSCAVLRKFSCSLSNISTPSYTSRLLASSFPLLQISSTKAAQSITGLPLWSAGNYLAERFCRTGKPGCV